MAASSDTAAPAIRSITGYQRVDQGGVAGIVDIQSAAAKVCRGIADVAGNRTAGNLCSAPDENAAAFARIVEVLLTLPPVISR